MIEYYNGIYFIDFTFTLLIHINNLFFKELNVNIKTIGIVLYYIIY